MRGDLPLPEHSYKQLVESINKYPLINLPYDYPIYSNSGIDLLGLSNVAANKRASTQPDNEPQSHEDLIKRDIFGPLSLNSSFYRVPYGTSLVADLAVPSKDHAWAVSVLTFTQHLKSLLTYVRTMSSTMLTPLLVVNTALSLTSKPLCNRSWIQPGITV